MDFNHLILASIKSYQHFYESIFELSQPPWAFTNSIKPVDCWAHYRFNTILSVHQLFAKTQHSDNLFTLNLKNILVKKINLLKPMLTFQNNYVFEKPTYTFGTRWPFCSINLFNLKFNTIKFLFDPYLLSWLK